MLYHVTLVTTDVSEEHIASIIRVEIICEPIYVTGVQYISSTIQLLEQIAKEQYEIKALADNPVKVESKTTECYSPTEQYTGFHTYRLKEETSYSISLKICTTP
jgi:hypothetical protein